MGAPLPVWVSYLVQVGKKTSSVKACVVSGSDRCVWLAVLQLEPGATHVPGSCSGRQVGFGLGAALFRLNVVNGCLRSWKTLLPDGNREDKLWDITLGCALPGNSSPPGQCDK